MGSKVVRGSTKERNQPEVIVSNKLCCLPQKKNTATPRGKLYALHMFQIFRTIGTGSYATVKLATDLTTNEPVVLKIMSKSQLIKKGQVEHIKGEHAVLSRAKSPLLIQMKGSFQTDLSLYYVLEFAPGGELFRLLNSKGNLSIEETIFFAAEIVCALSYLHNLSYAYRDLKPENVLLSATGHVKLADFGFVKTLKSGEKAYTLCGTPEYLAPEVIDRNGHGLEVDWWQFGILIYEMLFANTPFNDPSPYQLYENILSYYPDFPGCSDATKSLLKGLLQKRPERRLTEEGIKTHPFFAGVNWERAARVEMKPVSVPKLTSDLDAENFDVYADEDVEPGTPVLIDVFPEF